jgi:hypothetical protein
MIELSRRTIIIALVAFVAFAGLATASFVRTFTSTAEASHKFTDIGDTSWLHDSSAWLADNGIADGYANGNFEPGWNITRGQASYWFFNYNEAIEIVERGPVGSSGNQFTHYAACPAGKRAVAGGGTPTPPDIDLLMTASQPVLTTGGESRWVTIWTTRDRGTATANFTLWALCVPDAIP